MWHTKLPTDITLWAELINGRHFYIHTASDSSTSHILREHFWFKFVINFALWFFIAWRDRAICVVTFHPMPASLFTLASRDGTGDHRPLFHPLWCTRIYVYPDIYIPQNSYLHHYTLILYLLTCHLFVEPRTG